MSLDGCTCHLSAPCSFCESLTEEEADIFWRGGMAALLEHRRKKDDAADETEVA